MTLSSPSATGARLACALAPLLLCACGRAAAPNVAAGSASVDASVDVSVDDDLPPAARRESATVRRDVGRVRRATAAFRELDSAVAAGYPHDVARCLQDASQGVMGYHHMRRDLADARIEVDHPEILLYTRTATGEHQLNGVEYIVPYAAHPRDAAPPRVMGQALRASDPLQLWYLHVWVWTDNPNGLFADWNPAVRV